MRCFRPRLQFGSDYSDSERRVTEEYLKNFSGTLQLVQRAQTSIICHTMKWVTRKNVKVDRVACPWLIRRFIDPQAEFLFVAEDQLLETAQRAGAIPFDAPRMPEVKLNHRGDRCSFESIMEDYALIDPALQRLAFIVRAADVKGQE